MKNKAFTLIELLVIISIIGLLSSVTIVKLDDAKSQARDARRLADLNTIKKALEMYRIEKGVYPDTGGKTNSYWACTQTGYPQNEDWIPGLVPDYISKLPNDPRNPSNCAYDYNFRSDPQNYKLIARGPEDCKRIELKYPDLIDKYAQVGNPPVNRDCDKTNQADQAFGYWTEGAKEW